MSDYSLSVVTAFTPNFHSDFMLLCGSLRRFSSVRLIAIPLGFDEVPKINGVSILEVQHDIQANAKAIFGDRWVQWYKPFLIEMAAEHHNTNVILWLDSDIVITGDPHPLFAKIAEDFFVVGDYFAPKTCLNDESLYQEFTPHREFTKEESELALNSGVIGMLLPRDQNILDAWKDKINIVAERPDLIEKISLYDQGALLWAMRDLDVLSKIVHKPEWNYNPKRNAYDFQKQYVWPYGPKHMGGDIIDQVAYDNPKAVVAHFAGLPKLSHLINVDSQPARQHRHNVHRHEEPAHIFGIGLERAGTHTLAEMLRGSCRYDSWVRHEYTPGISEAALRKWRGEPSDGSIEKRCELYNRTDVQFISEVNHRLSFFVPEIKERVKNAKFILLLRNPFDLIRSRLKNYSCYNSKLRKYPISYQLELYKLHREFGDGSTEQNIYRITPDADLSVIETYVWEITETLKFVLRDLKQLPESEYRIIWVESLRKSINKIRNLVPKHYFDWSKMAEISTIHFGTSKKPNNVVDDWINGEIDTHSELISSSVFNILREYEVNIHEQDFV